MTMEAAPLIYSALNEQIKQKHYSAELYYAMAAHCSALRLPGFARWFRARAADAQVQAMRLTTFMSRRGEAAVFTAFQDPPSQFDTIAHMLQHSLRREQLCAAWLEEIAAFAAKTRDAEAEGLVKRCLEEQEEAKQLLTQAMQLVAALGDGERVPALLDDEMGQRAADATASPG